MEQILSTFGYIGVWLLAFIAIAVVYSVAERYLKIYKERLDNLITPEQWRSAQNMAYMLVRAAEQIYGIEGSNEEKLEYTLDLITKYFPQLDKDILRAIIEAAVKELKYLEDDILKD